MNQLTVTVDLTPRNLEILKQLCFDAPDFSKVLKELDKRPVIPFPAAAPAEPAVEEPAPAQEPAQAPAPEPEAPRFSKMDVKAVCMKLSKEGRQSELRAAFEKFGGKKFSDIKESDYPALMKELGNG